MSLAFAQSSDVPTHADLAVHVLVRLGAQRVFGIPGGALEPFYNALADAQSRGELELITARHESGALGMAEGGVIAGDRFGVCCATNGPGALNMVTASASALLESRPVVIVTAQAALPKLGRGVLQDSSCDAIDTVAVFKSVAKYSTLVSHPDQVLPKFYKAVRLALQAPCGPVHLSVPTDVFSTLFDGPLPELAPVPFAEMEQLDPVATRGALDALRAAARPLLVLGEECESAAEHIEAYLRVHPVPVVTTSAGHRWFPATHGRYRGVVGFAGHASAEALVRDADVVLVAGSLFRDLCVSSAVLPAAAKVWHIAGSPKGALATPTPARSVGVGVGAFFRAAIAHAGAALRSPAWYPPAWRPPRDEREGKPGPLSPVTGLRALLASVASDSVVLLDTGNSWVWGIHHLPIGQPLARMVSSMGFAQMGWAIGAATGAAFARRASARSGTTVCITGDGSWLMTGQELVTAVEHRLPVLYVVLRDGALGMILTGQRRRGAREVGSALPRVSFARQARAAGARAVTVRTPAQLLGLDLAQMLSQPGPVLVELVIDRDFGQPPRVGAASGA